MKSYIDLQRNNATGNKKLRKFNFLRVSIMRLVCLIQNLNKNSFNENSRKGKKTTWSLDYNTKSLKKSPNIIYVYLSFYGFKKLNNVEKIDSRKNNF